MTLQFIEIFINTLNLILLGLKILDGGKKKCLHEIHG